jgi:hypothetical protein
VTGPPSGDPTEASAPPAGGAPALDDEVDTLDSPAELEAAEAPDVPDALDVPDPVDVPDSVEVSTPEPVAVAVVEPLVELPSSPPADA